LINPLDWMFGQVGGHIFDLDRVFQVDGCEVTDA
jgi:hypothetical protein